MPSLIVKPKQRKFLRIGGKEAQHIEDVKPDPEQPPVDHPSSDHLVECERDGKKFIVFSEGPEHRGDNIVGRLAFLSPAGKLIKSETKFLISKQEIRKDVAIPEGMEVEERQVKRFDTFADMETKAMTTVRAKDEEGNEVGPILDYQDVTVDGMASTFQDVTPYDRDGDAIAPGAFDDSLPQFKKNPVMLTDHRNSVHSVAGSFTTVSKIKDGLAVSGKISNAPDMQSVRFKIAEGHLKAFSIGGFFFFSPDDHHLIEEIELLEISLVAIPANPDALFASRSVQIADAIKSYQQHLSKILNNDSKKES